MVGRICRALVRRTRLLAARASRQPWRSRYGAVADIYRAMLRREPDPDGLAHYAAVLEKQGLREVIESFVNSGESVPFPCRARTLPLTGVQG